MFNLRAFRITRRTVSAGRILFLFVVAFSSCAYLGVRSEKAAEAPAVPVSTAAEPVSVEIVEKEKDAPARTVFIQMGKVEGAKKYEVEIKSDSQKWRTPHQFSTVGGTLRIRLTPSKYMIRTRSSGKGNERGQWSPWQDFVVPFRSVANLVPTEGAVIQSTGSENQFQTFEWPKVEKATGYYVEIRDKNQKPLRQVRTTATWLTSPLASATTYHWCVLPLADFKNEEPSLGDCQFSSFRIEESRTDLPAALAQVEIRPDALGYQYEIIRYEDENSLGDPIIVESETPHLRAQLKAGEYELRVRTLFPKDYRTSWSPPQKFFVRQPPPQPIGPLLGSEIEGGETGEGEVMLQWQAIPGAERYDVYVFDKEGKIFFQSTTKESFILAKLPEDRDYLWKVVAYSPREPNRAPASVVDTKDASSFYVKPYFPYQLSVSESVAPVYSWARYTISSADYYSESYDDNAIVRQSIQAGELDLAFGYWHRKSRLGLLAQLGMQGYKTTVDSAYFKSGSVNLGYRFVWEGNERGRVWLGYGYREIASLTANPSTLKYDIRSLNAAGPKFQFTYGNQFNESWGYQFHGKGFLGIQDKGTPNGEKQGTQVSLSLSGSLTHALSARTIGLFGYTYQLDSSSYESADTPGKTNTTKISGHYLNLGVEFAVGPVRK